MDRIKKLCERQNPDTRRLILAAYWLGCADGLKISCRTPKTDFALPKRQAE